MERRLQTRSLSMKRTLSYLMIVAAAACSQPSKSTQAKSQNEMKTIDNADPRPAVFDPPPILADEGTPPLKSTVGIAQPDAPPPPTPQDEALRASLPFVPAIGMDPVDGSKISIRTSTPMADFKGKIFYFSSDENKRTFLANPELFMKGAFSHL